MPRPKDSDQFCRNCYFGKKILPQTLFSGTIVSDAWVKKAMICMRMPPTLHVVFRTDINPPQNQFISEFAVSSVDGYCGEWRPGADE